MVLHELGREQKRGISRPSIPEHRRPADDEAGAAAKLTFGRLAMGSSFVAELGHLEIISNTIGDKPGPKLVMDSMIHATERQEAITITTF